MIKKSLIRQFNDQQKELSAFFPNQLRLASFFFFDTPPVQKNISGLSDLTHIIFQCQ